MTQTNAQAPIRTMITINGKSIEALTPDRVGRMVKGMIDKGRAVSAAHCGTFNKNIKVIGDGTPFETPIGLSFIYNTDLISDVAFDAPKAQEAQAQIDDLIAGGNATAEEMHDACREFLNAITVSFNVRSRKFKSGQLVNGIPTLVTTEKGSLITLRDVSAMEAVALTNDGTVKRDFSKWFAKPAATELVSTPASAAQATVAETANAAAQS